jgi:hypothetical protein
MEKGRAPPRGVGDVEVAQAVGDLPPRAAMNAQEARLARVEAAVLDAIEDGGRLQGLEERPGAAAAGQIAQ